MAGDRTADEIQRDIEQARASLAVAVDQITYRTNPKRVVENAKASLVRKARTPQGKAVIGGAGVLTAFMIIRRIRKH
ncbi:MAG: DUF3618 domain-containing protein [Jatrophihabitantaceae bacterium]